MEIKKSIEFDKNKVRGNGSFVVALWEKGTLIAHLYLMDQESIIPSLKPYHVTKGHTAIVYQVYGNVKRKIMYIIEFWEKI